MLSDDPVHENVMAATSAALSEHGFAGLTMRDVAGRTDTSKSTLHYRYDSKEGLLTTFLEHITVQMEQQFAQFEDRDPLQRLVDLLDANLTLLEDPEQAPLNAAYLEIHARASRNEAFRDAIAENDRRYRTELAEIIDNGIETGVFREVDPQATATLLIAVPDSAGLHQATLGNEDTIDDLRTAINDLVLGSLLAADVSVDQEELL